MHTPPRWLDSVRLRLGLLMAAGASVCAVPLSPAVAAMALREPASGSAGATVPATAPPTPLTPPPPPGSAAAAEAIVRRYAERAGAINTAVGVWRVTELIRGEGASAAEGAHSAAFSFGLWRENQAVVVAGDGISGGMFKFTAWVRAGAPGRPGELARLRHPQPAHSLNWLRSASGGRLEIPPLAVAVVAPGSSSTSLLGNATRLISTRPERLGNLDGDWVVAELPWPGPGPAPQPPAGAADRPAPPAHSGEFWFERVSGLLYAARVDMTAVYRAQGRPVASAKLLGELDSLRVEPTLTPATFEMPRVEGDRSVAVLTPPPPPPSPPAPPAPPAAPAPGAPR